VTRRLQVLFLLSLLGVLLAVGVVVGEVAGPVGAAGYALAAGGLVVLGAARARRASASRRLVRHCTCCDGDHAAPVQVV
jgi:hypothetical protein